MPLKNKIGLGKYLILTILILVFYFPSYFSNDLLKKLTVEDGLYENIGALFFLFASLSFLVLVVKPNLYRKKNESGKFIERYYFLFLALLLFFAFGEEISWGQRIFNYSTPEAIKEHNLQGEFNVHNLEIFSGITRDGEEKGSISLLLNLSKLFSIFWIMFLLIIPLLYRFNMPFRNLSRKLSIPIPSILFGLLFCFNLQYENVLRWINNDLDVHGLVEIKESVTALISFALPLFWIHLKNAR